MFLVAEPALLLGGAAWLTRAWAGIRSGWLALAVRYTYSIVPLGFGMWLAHYGYHFFTGLYTIIPLTQNALAEWGWPVLGEPRWTLVGWPKTMRKSTRCGRSCRGLRYARFCLQRRCG